MNNYNARNRLIVIAGTVGAMMLSGQIYATDYCTDQPVDGIIYKVINAGAGADMLMAAESTANKANVELQKIREMIPNASN
ncbi:hypothetical protein P4S72_29975 [Vibrio sp. PP-XX7]